MTRKADTRSESIDMPRRAERDKALVIRRLCPGGGGKAWPGFEIDHSERSSRVAISRAGRRPRGAEPAVVLADDTSAGNRAGMSVHGISLPPRQRASERALCSIMSM